MRLVKEQKMSKNFYVYYSYEEYGRGYIGSRGCKCLPEEDFKYFGSFHDKTFKPTEKIILGVYETRKDAYKAEILLHEFYDVARNPHFANRSKQTSTGFTTEGLCGELSSSYGKTHTPEAKAKLSALSKGRKLTEEHKRKIGAKHKGKKLSEEQKRIVGSWERTPEYRKKLSIARKKRVTTEETKRRMSETKKRQYAIKRLIKSLTNPNSPQTIDNLLQFHQLCVEK